MAPWMARAASRPARPTVSSERTASRMEPRIRRIAYDSKDAADSGR